MFTLLCIIVRYVCLLLNALPVITISSLSPSNVPISSPSSSSLSLTPGTFLLSGGEECVLVVWQLGLNEKHFRPRLGAPITRVSCAPADQNFAVSLQNNSKHFLSYIEFLKNRVNPVIQVVSGLNNNVEWTVGGLRRSHTQTPGENGMRTGLVWDPRSLSLVANSNPGSLQWYRPDLDQVTCQVYTFHSACRNSVSEY
jgi:hypothetical protein